MAKTSDTGTKGIPVVGKIVEKFDQLPHQTKLAGFFALVFLGVLMILKQNLALDGWQWISAIAIAFAYFAFSVWIHRPQLEIPSQTAPPYFVLDAPQLQQLAATPVGVLVGIEAATALLRQHIRDIATRVRKRKKNNTEADVVAELVKILRLPSPLATSLLAWA